MGNIESEYLMVRAMGSTDDDFAVFFEKNVVAVGWSQVDFASYQSGEDLAHAVQNEYFGGDKKVAPQVVGRRMNAVRRFKRIKQGDRIIVPYRDSVRMAEAQAAEKYDPEIKDTLDLSNQRKVSYVREKSGEILTIPRYKLSEGLQRRLRVRGSTVADLGEFSDEINGLYEKGKKGEKLGWEESFEEKRGSLKDELKSKLLENIRQGRTNLDAGGQGLEKLVKELLEADGYQASLLSKQHFSGYADADISASKSDRVQTTKLLVQVKHHSGQSSTWGAEQLDQIHKEHPEEYPDVIMVLVTTADASAELKEFCEAKDVVLVAGADLIDWIIDALPKLSPDTKIHLGISDLPVLIG